MADESGEKSEFNYALSFLNVLLKLEINCYDARNYSDVYGWYNALVNMNSHLLADMSPSEKDTAESFRINTHPLVQVNMRNKYSKGGIDFSLYNQLYDWEKFLKGIISTKGYRGKMKNAMSALEA